MAALEFEALAGRIIFARMTREPEPAIVSLACSWFPAFLIYGL